MHTLIYNNNHTPDNSPLVIADISAAAATKLADRTNNPTGWYVRTLLPDGKTRLRPLALYRSRKPATTALPR